MELTKLKLDLLLPMTDPAVVPTTIESNESLFSKWWFWTGVGAVVVGAVATTVALTSGSAGTIREGELGTSSTRDWESL